MSQSTVLLLPCANQNDLEANQNDLEGNLLDFPVEHTCENYIFLKVAEVLVVPPKVLTVCVRSLLTSKVSWARRQTNVYRCWYWKNAIKINY